MHRNEFRSPHRHAKRSIEVVEVERLIGASDHHHVCLIIILCYPMDSAEIVHDIPLFPEQETLGHGVLSPEIFSGGGGRGQDLLGSEGESSAP